MRVELIAEKKGLFRKHVEYEVSRLRFKSSVYRPCKDFAVFHETLLPKIPYRGVLALPPKRLRGAHPEFSEPAPGPETLHYAGGLAPLFSEDVALGLFLSFSGPAVRKELKDSAPCAGDDS